MIRSILKWFSIVFVVLALLAGGLVANVVWFKPVTLNLFFERTFFRFALNSPQTLTSAGILDGLPFNVHQGRLDEVSVAHTEGLGQFAEDSLNTLRRFNRERYEGQQALSYDIFEWFLANQVDGNRWTWHQYPLHQMSGIHTQLPIFMSRAHPIRNKRDVDFYLQRLAGFPAAFAGTVERLRESERRGVIAPRFSIETTLASMRDFVGQPVSDNVLYTSLMERVEAIEHFPDERRASLSDELTETILNSVYPAFETLIAHKESQLARADSYDGVWRLPDGDEYYAWVARSQTTTDLTPAEIHDLGLVEVERIQAEMDDILCGQVYC